MISQVECKLATCQDESRSEAISRASAQKLLSKAANCGVQTKRRKWTPQYVKRTKVLASGLLSIASLSLMVLGSAGKARLQEERQTWEKRKEVCRATRRAVYKAGHAADYRVWEAPARTRKTLPKNHLMPLPQAGGLFRCPQIAGSVSSA